jgi:hypothetical protein
MAELQLLALVPINLFHFRDAEDYGGMSTVVEYTPVVDREKIASHTAPSLTVNAIHSHTPNQTIGYHVT